MRLVLILLLAVTHSVEASCEKKRIPSKQGGMDSYKTVCDSDWERLGTGIGWARLCGYSGDLRKRLLAVHKRIKKELGSNSGDPALKKAYQSAVLKFAHYDSASDCSESKVEKIIADAETMLNRSASAPTKQLKSIDSSPTKSPNDKRSGELPALENSTALVLIDEQIRQLTVKSDGDEYRKVWDAVASNNSIDVGVLVSDKDIEPKRFEFSWNPLQNGFATKIDGVATILIGDDRIFSEVSGAYKASGQYVYIGAKFNDTMRFRWWRLTRALR